MKKIPLKRMKIKIYKNFFQTYNTQGYLYNNNNKFYNKNKNEKDKNNNQDLFDRMNNINKNKIKYTISIYNKY